MGRMKKARYKSPVNEASSQIVCMYVCTRNYSSIYSYIHSFEMNDQTSKVLIDLLTVYAVFLN